jgi:acyl-CoA thioesterase YciA
MCVLDKNVESTGELAIRVVAMPADTNPSGDIFGGWLLSQMDLAGSVVAKKIAKSKVVTIAINDMVFKSPVFVGDTLCCYVDVVKVGRTSITVNIESWVNRELSEGKRFKVTEGVFTYVKVDENNKPSVI